MEGKSLKIGVVTTFYGKAGGIGRHVFELAERLAESNDVHLFVPSYRKEVVSKRARLSPHKVPAIRRPFPFDVIFNTIMNTVFAKLLGITLSLDIIYSQSSYSLSPDVVCLHGCYKAWLRIANKSDQKINILARLHNWFVLGIEKYNVERGSKRIIAVSKKVEKEISENYNVSSRKLTVIYNGINVDEFSPSKNYSNTRRMLGIKPSDFVILLVAGHDYEKKGVPEVFRALQLLEIRDFKFVVVGYDRLIDRFRSYAQKLNVKEKVVFVGYVDPTELTKIYAMSDIFILPSKYDAFPLVVLEAMASGLPVVISKAVGSIEIISEGEDGLVLQNPADSKEIAEKISFLANNGVFKKMGSKARKKAEEHSWDKKAKELLEVFLEISKV